VGIAKTKQDRTGRISFYLEYNKIWWCRTAGS